MATHIETATFFVVVGDATRTRDCAFDPKKRRSSGLPAFGSGLPETQRSAPAENHQIVSEL
jgi:hypothetical protein